MPKVQKQSLIQSRVRFTEVRQKSGIQNVKIKGKIKKCDKVKHLESKAGNITLERDTRYKELAQDKGRQGVKGNR